MENLDAVRHDQAAAHVYAARDAGIADVSARSALLVAGSAALAEQGDRGVLVVAAQHDGRVGRVRAALPTRRRPGPRRGAEPAGPPRPAGHRIQSPRPAARC